MKVYVVIMTNGNEVLINATSSMQAWQLAIADGKLPYSVKLVEAPSWWQLAIADGKLPQR